MSARLLPIELTRKHVLYDVDRRIEHVYFIESGVASVLSFFEDGSSIETSTIGNEGMVGIVVYLGAESVNEQAFVQVSGNGFQLKASDLCECTANCPAFSKLLGRYTVGLLRLGARTSACHRIHSIEQRCARWLLLAHDRAGRDSFAMTQQFLAKMLGVRRATVSVVASNLHKTGGIEYKRGSITIVDRKILKEASCECYNLIRDEFARAVKTP